MNLLNQTIKRIKPADKENMNKAAKRLDTLIKPIGSLGGLEEIAVRISGIRGDKSNYINKKCIIVMASDNGVWEEGVSTSPQEITAMQSVNITRGLAGVSVLARHARSDLKVVDIGIKHEYRCDQITERKIRKGTDNFTKGPAMSREECIKAIEAGIEITSGLVSEGYDLLGTGEMGIGNTSSSSAVVMGLTGCSAEEAVGRGAGLTDELLLLKKEVIAKGVELNKPDSSDPVDVLCKVGGFDLAGLAGCYLAAAANRIPMVIDGFISATAAMAAWKICPGVKEYMFASHISNEPGYRIIMKEMGLKPPIDLEMRLGEGTGCALMFNIIEAALAVIDQMATFDEVMMQSKHLVDIRKNIEQEVV